MNEAVGGRGCSHALLLVPPFACSIFTPYLMTASCLSFGNPGVTEVWGSRLRHLIASDSCLAVISKRRGFGHPTPSKPEFAVVQCPCFSSVQSKGRRFGLAFEIVTSHSARPTQGWGFLHYSPLKVKLRKRGVTINEMHY